MGSVPPKDEDHHKRMLVQKQTRYKRKQSCVQVMKTRDGQQLRGCNQDKSVNGRRETDCQLTLGANNVRESKDTVGLTSCLTSWNNQKAKELHKPWSLNLHLSLSDKIDLSSTIVKQHKFGILLDQLNDEKADHNEKDAMMLMLNMKIKMIGDKDTEQYSCRV